MCSKKKYKKNTTKNSDTALCDFWSRNTNTLNDKNSLLFVFEKKITCKSTVARHRPTHLLTHIPTHPPTYLLTYLYFAIVIACTQCAQLRQTSLLCSLTHLYTHTYLYTYTHINTQLYIHKNTDTHNTRTIKCTNIVTNSQATTYMYHVKYISYTIPQKNLKALHTQKNIQTFFFTKHGTSDTVQSMSLLVTL